VGPGAINYKAGLDSWLAARAAKKASGSDRRRASNCGMAFHLCREIYKEAPLGCAACGLVAALAVAAAVVVVVAPAALQF